MGLEEGSRGIYVYPWRLIHTCRPENRYNTAVTISSNLGTNTFILAAGWRRLEEEGSCSVGCCSVQMGRGSGLDEGVAAGRGERGVEPRA